MVKKSILILLIALNMTLSGCTVVKSVWHAKAPGRKTVVLESKPLPSFSKVFSENDEESQSTFQEWKNSILGSFRQIEGSTRDYLSRDEIRVLVKSGLVKLDENPSTSADRALAVLEILGFKDGIGIRELNALFDWIDSHKREARDFYHLFMSETYESNQIHARQIISVVNLFGSFVSLLGDQEVSAKHMGELILPWVPISHARARNALTSGIELGISFFASFCGDRVSQSSWNGKKIGNCLRSLTAEFESTTPAIDFIFGYRSPAEKPATLIRAADEFETRVRAWIEGHRHPLFPVRRVEQFSKDLSIPAPYAFLKLTEWIPKLNADSTLEGFSPRFFIELAGVMRTWINDAATASKTSKCETLENWKSCTFDGQYEPAAQLFNGEYATLIRTPTLGFVSKVALYHALSGFIFNKLDMEKTGEIGSRIKELISLSIRLLDSNAFTQNVIAALLEKPVELVNTEDSLKAHTRIGLSELAALAADLIPNRDQNGRTLLRKLQSQILGREKRMPYSMDRIGLTAFIYLFDLIGSMNMDYLSRYDLPVKTEGTLRYVNRRKIIQAFPGILFDHFPRIYNECVAWGFERTCGVVFNEILPNSLPGRDDLESYEIDVITLSAVLIESMMSRCDRNSDDVLSGNPIDGYDEKNCMITVSTALAKRLMNAGFVDQDHQTEFLMKLTNHFFVAKWAAKAALSRGTVKGIAWFALPAANWLTGAASLGSVMSVAAELMDPDKVRAVEAGTDGPIDSPGDELLYHNRLTDYHLPRPKKAPRYGSPSIYGEKP
ncbi:MAG: hypothetical protein KGP28_08575 [Bdellovibrionales bacterium]|nr:hypothetical protein [Bdellovibrionales bacterium]